MNIVTGARLAKGTNLTGFQGVYSQLDGTGQQLSTFPTSPPPRTV
jgi:hypothetical protein